MQIRLNDPPKYNELYIQFYLTIGNIVIYQRKWLKKT